MTNKSIYSILSSKPHNEHYLKRYVKFIESCAHQDFSNQYTEKHHICPKAKDLFPEYKSFKTNPWNKVVLTARHHFIAHWMLWKTFGGSQIYAFKSMVDGQKSKYQKRYTKINSRIYESLKNDFGKINSILKKTPDHKKCVQSSWWKRLPIRKVNLYFLDIKITVNCTIGYPELIPYYEQGWTKEITDEYKNFKKLEKNKKISSSKIGCKSYIRTEEHRTSQSQKLKGKIGKITDAVIKGRKSMSEKISKTIWMHNLYGKNVRIASHMLNEAIEQGYLIGYAQGTHRGYPKKINQFS